MPTKGRERVGSFDFIHLDRPHSPSTSSAMKILLFGFLLFILNFASSASTSAQKALNAVHEIITNNTHLILDHQIIENFEEEEEFLKKSEENFLKNFEEKFMQKIERLEEKMNDLLKHLLNASEVRLKSDAVTSLCHSTCRAKINTWANSTNASQLKAKLERMEFTCDLSQQKAFNACHPNPCLHGGKCLLSATGSDYLCSCSQLRNGTRCETLDAREFTCEVEKRCWRLNDTLYMVFETALTWAAAQDKCANEGGMSLAMPKDQERTQFLVDQLGPIYNAKPYDWLWLGLKRDEGKGSRGWYWVDGSDLGEYTGGWEDMKRAPNALFGILNLNGGSYMWHWGLPTHQHYPICEIHLSSS